MYAPMPKAGQVCEYIHTHTQSDTRTQERKRKRKIYLQEVQQIFWPARGAAAVDEMDVFVSVSLSVSVSVIVIVSVSVIVYASVTVTVFSPFRSIWSAFWQWHPRQRAIV